MKQTILTAVYIQVEHADSVGEDRTLVGQAYFNLIKASWILVDISARHPQLNLLDATVCYEIEIISEVCFRYSKHKGTK